MVDAGERNVRDATEARERADRDAPMRERSRRCRHDRSSVSNADACLLCTSRSYSDGRALETFLPVGENSGEGGQRRRAFAEPAAANRAARSRGRAESSRRQRSRRGKRHAKVAPR
ncbi:hypothetical protein ASD86_24415 [Lysobacter sp. Root690]|nr:hypothetical protein ASD86_24415 [Lysobacter sp. Root690]